MVDDGFILDVVTALSKQRIDYCFSMTQLNMVVEECKKLNISIGYKRVCDEKTGGLNFIEITPISFTNIDEDRPTNECLIVDLDNIPSNYKVSPSHSCNSKPVAIKEEKKLPKIRNKKGQRSNWNNFGLDEQENVVIPRIENYDIKPSGFSDNNIKFW